MNKSLAQRKKSRVRRKNQSPQSLLRSLVSLSNLAIIGGVIIGIIAIVLLINAYNTQAQQAQSLPAGSLNLANIPDNSIATISQGQQHIDPGTKLGTYNSNPPTSGPHYPSPSDTGIYTNELPDETVIHNLEHGHIWLSYRDANDQDAIRVLSDIQRKYAGWVIVTYRPKDDSRVAAAAWTRLLKLDSVDAQQIEAFVLRYTNKAPESIAGGQ